MNNNFDKHQSINKRVNRTWIAVLIICLVFTGLILFFPSQNNGGKENNAIPPVKDITPQIIEASAITSEQETLPLFHDNALKTAGFVNIKELSPLFYFDIRYATTNNFTGKVIYDTDQCYLQKEASEGILKALKILQKRDEPLTFIFYDCYRPQSAQEKLWLAYPNPSYVARPEKGSRHSRGMAVDLTLAKQDGTPLPMPTEFDSFKKEAHMDYNGSSVSKEALENRDLLKKVMTEAGFTYTRTEWWHFDKTGWKQKPVQNIDF
ncbi:D-Alanyl-D-alanine dipeptidase [Elusimicrobium minutum Pei191]|uniref:D-alanyl-D-alanine dipeptidase n=1 Tax=Elusimicrobium minutum (strain Pei191) TaxID=445932 RepID=B2KCZ4_ELUMP|nr:M15 family metallopeptidase [Elusimicrobium minutum]ACC98390.1 D-Alanyl-D-alanine dipeptidase [Elusimicrobium minutum Pei191]